MLRYNITYQQYIYSVFLLPISSPEVHYKSHEMYDVLSFVNIPYRQLNTQRSAVTSEIKKWYHLLSD